MVADESTVTVLAVICGWITAAPLRRMPEGAPWSEQKKPVCQGAIWRWNAIFLTAQHGTDIHLTGFRVAAILSTGQADRESGAERENH